jgi:hypothetical protein
MSDYHDFVQLPAEGQVTPTNYVQGGVLTTVSQPQYIGTPTTAQLTTQVNPGVPSYGINSVVQAEQQLAVAPFTYNSPGSHNINSSASGGP